MAKRKGPIHRRIPIHIWGEEGVRLLSRPQPCGQWLLVQLLAGEQTCQIPGLMRIGEHAFAEQLDWTVEGFRHAFAEVMSQGFAHADWRARVVWVPIAVPFNPPSSVNVVKNWKVTWDLIPDCSLKAQAWETIYAFLLGMSKAYSQAFERACRKPSLLACGIQGSGIRDQESGIRNQGSGAGSDDPERAHAIPEGKTEAKREGIPDAMREGYDYSEFVDEHERQREAFDEGAELDATTAAVAPESHQARLNGAGWLTELTRLVNVVFARVTNSPTPLAYGHVATWFKRLADENPTVPRGEFLEAFDWWATNHRDRTKVTPSNFYHFGWGDWLAQKGTLAPPDDLPPEGHYEPICQEPVEAGGLE